MKKKLADVTLLGIDCIDFDRLILAVEICLKSFDFAEVKLLTSLDPGGHSGAVIIDQIKTVEEYSEFVLSKLNEHVNTPHVLIIQYDGFILNPSAWEDDFLNYDYIGAPWLVEEWAIRDFDFPKEKRGELVVGNGGFSLRSKRLLALTAELFTEGVFERYHPEDTAICVYYREVMEKYGIKFAPVEVAKRFSFEGKDDEHIRWDGQFGFHSLKYTDISKWVNRNPQYPIKNDLE